MPKQYNDFLELHRKMEEKFSGTVLPVLPKKTLIVNDAVIKERMHAVDNFLKFLASTPKLASNHLLLEFLG